MSGNIVSDFNTLSIEVSCEGAPVPTAACAQWQQGIGNPNGDGVTQGVVGLAQDAIFRRFYSVDWTPARQQVTRSTTAQHTTAKTATGTRILLSSSLPIVRIVLNSLVFPWRSSGDNLNSAADWSSHL